ncbi:MAG: HAD hydrolase-like protein [bacterium]|nr:HAD hydrolase-like protein [bacterium]
MNIQAIVLDFDGSIVESVGIKDKAFESLFREYPEQLSDIMEYHRSHNATIRYEKFKYITEEILHQSYSEIIDRKLSEEFSRFIFEKIVACPYVSGAKEFLEYFYGTLPLYLISMTPEEELASILQARHLSMYFKKIYAYPWKKKDGIQNILHNERCSPEQLVFIGDTLEDYQAASECGAHFIGRYSGRPFGQLDIPLFKDLTAMRNYLIAL